MDSIQASAELSQPLLMMPTPKALRHCNHSKNQLSRCREQSRNIRPLHLQIALQLQVATFHNRILGYCAPSSLAHHDLSRIHHSADHTSIRYISSSASRFPAADCTPV